MVLRCKETKNECEIYQENPLFFTSLKPTTSFSILNSQFSIPNSQFPILNSQFSIQKKVSSLDKPCFIIYICREIDIREIFLKNIRISLQYKYLLQEKQSVSFHKHYLLFTKLNHKMKKETKKSAPTFESVWAALQETDRILTEKFNKTDRMLSKKFAAAERRIEKAEKKAEKAQAAFEKRWEQTQAAFDKTQAAFDKKWEKDQAAFDKTQAAYDKKWEKDQAAYEKRWEQSEYKTKKLEELMGSWANNQGLFAEEYFSNSFYKGKRNFFGEKFDRMENNAKGITEGYQDEYDILLINGKSVGIIEVKFKAHENDIPKVLRKATTFRVNFPNYENHRVYLGLATMAFYPALEQECINQGIAIIKQEGDSVVINDGHLKVF